MTPFSHNKEEEKKSNKRLMAKTILGETKKKPKEMPKDA
jgi:hypothetical protein